MSQGSSGTNELWGIPTAAHYLRLSENALRCRIKRGGIPRDCIVRIGRSVRFLAKRMRDWISNGAR